MSRTGLLALALLCIPALVGWGELTPRTALDAWDLVPVETGPTFPSAPWVAFFADDLNGNGDSNAGWSDLDTIDNTSPWVSSGSFTADLEDGASPQFLVASCDGHPCVRGASGDWSQAKSTTPAQWNPIGASGAQFSCHLYLRTTASNPNALYTVYATSTGTTSSRGSLLYYDDRAASAREDKILWRHYPAAGSESIDSDDDALDEGNWRVISIDYPGESSGGNVTLYSDGVSVGTVAVSASYNDGDSTVALHLGSAAGSFPFQGDYRGMVCYTGAGSQGLAASVTTAFQARFP